MPASLVGIRQKIKRADQHIRELDKLVRAFRKRCRCRVVSKFDAQAGCHRFWIERSPARIPWRFSIITGETLYHLRSSLDHLVWQLVIREGKVSPGGQHQFPIYNQRPATKKGIAIFEGKIEGVPVAAKAAIERLQPYQLLTPAKRDLHPLGVLSELNNADKHRRTLTVAQAYVERFRSVGGSGKSAAYFDRITGTTLKRVVPLKNGARLGYIEAPPDVKVKVEPSPEIAITKVGAPGYQPVLPCLEYLRKSVVGIIDEFERRFF